MKDIFLSVSIDTTNLSQIDSFLDVIFQNDAIFSRVKQRVRYHLNTVPKSIVEAISDLQDGEIDNLLRIITHQDEDIRFLTHQLQGYDSLIKKYDSLSVKSYKLKSQNKRLLERNKELADRLYKKK